MKPSRIILLYLALVCSVFRGDSGDDRAETAARVKALEQRAIAEHKAQEEEAYVRHIFQMHTNAASGSNLLAITVIGDQGRVFWPYIVTEDGSKNDCCITRQAISPQRWATLSKKELSDLHAALIELPTNSMSPPLGRTVLVSYRFGTDWITRTYDFQQQPVALRRIFRIIGEREDSKPTP